MEYSFTGKKILVTGAGSGIGRELCKALHKQGAVVFALSRTPEKLVTLVQECPGIRTIEVDLEDWDKTREVLKDLEVMDALVNNAGMGWSDCLMDFDPANFDKVMNTNVKSAVNVSQLIATKMIDAEKPGSIVNVSSLMSRIGSKISLTYPMSKAAMDMMTKCMALQLGPKNIRVNSVNPGIVMTPMGKYWWEVEPRKTIMERTIQRTPLRKVCDVEDVVNTILFLLSDASPMVNGQIIVLDGGFTAG